MMLAQSRNFGRPYCIRQVDMIGQRFLTSSLIIMLNSHIMHQQNQAVQNIINTFISKSRKNSIANLPNPATSSTPQPPAIEDYNDVEEFTIRTEDLRQFVQSIAKQKDELNRLLQQKDIQLKKLKKIDKSPTQNDLLSVDAKSGKELLYQKHIQDLQARLENDKRRRQTLEKDYKYTQNKLKDAQFEIEHQKQTIATRENFIKTLVNKQKQAAVQSQNPQKQVYATPRRYQAKKLQMIPSIMCQSIQPKENSIQPSNNSRPTDLTKQSYFEYFQSNKKSQTQPQEPLTFNTSTKDVLLMKLGEKCLFLEQYIQSLTKKLLGEISHNDQSSRVKINMIHSIDQPLKTEQSSSKKQILTFIEDENEAFNVDID